jgi:hypothetical protein
MMTIVLTGVPSSANTGSKDSQMVVGRGAGTDKGKHRFVMQPFQNPPLCSRAQNGRVLFRQ